MKKKVLFSSVLAVALAFATSSTFVSCKNYDDDISSLQSRVSSLEATVSSLNSQITAGSTITNVSTDGDAIKVTLSNGKTYSFESADNADAQLVKVGEDGYLYYYDVTTGKYVKTDISADTDTNTYVSDIQIDSNGNLVLVYSDDTANKTTTITITGSSSSSSTGSNASAYWDGKDLVLNIDGESYRIAANNALRSLVFIPDAYVDGVEALVFYRYYSKGILNNKGSEPVAGKLYNGSKTDEYPDVDETWSYTADSAVYATDHSTTAHYRMNPSTAAIPTGGKFVGRDVAYFKTRTASKDFSMKVAGLSLSEEGGILKVKTETEGTPAAGDSITRFAFRAAVEGKDSVTSDYATVAGIQLKDARIASRHYNGVVNNEPTHIRRFLKKLDTEANCAIKNQIVAVESETEAANYYDLKLTYDSVKDNGCWLDTIFTLHLSYGDGEKILSVEDAKEKLNFTFKYDLVRDYKLGEAYTKQDAFVHLEGENNAYIYFTEKYGRAVIGRTPIVRVQVIAGDVPVAVGYVRIFIDGEEESKLDTLGDFTVGTADTIKLDCTTSEAELTVTWDSINENVYAKVTTDDGDGLSKEQFHAKYPVYVDIDSATTAGKEVVHLITQDDGGSTTWTLKYIFTDEDYLNKLIEDEVKTVKHKVAFYNTALNEVVYVTVVANLENVASTYEVPLTDAKYMKEFWNSTKDTTYFNVEVPDLGEKDAEKDSFINNLNAPFVTLSTGELDIDYTIYDGGVDYYFHSTNERTFDNYEMKVSDDAQTLYMQVKGDASTRVVIAKIDNEGTTKYAHDKTTNLPNAIVLLIDKANKGEVYDKARELLNAGTLTVHIGANATRCASTGGKQVAITFKGKPYFIANYVTPVYMSSEGGEDFTDGVTFGDEGSILRLTDLVSLYDWRWAWGTHSDDYKFGTTKVDYYKYYAVDSIVIDVNNLKCNINGDATFSSSIPSQIVINYYNAKKGEGSDLVSEYKVKADDFGYLTYRNNGSPLLEEFMIKAPAKVYYKWGIARPYGEATITITVNETVSE